MKMNVLVLVMHAPGRVVKEVENAGALLATVPRQVTHLIANHVKEITTADLLAKANVVFVMVKIR